MNSFNLENFPQEYQNQIASKLIESRKKKVKVDDKDVEKESELQKECNAYFTVLRNSARIVDFFHMRKAKGNSKGLPDLLVFLPDSKILFIELKTKKGKLTKEQLKFQARCKMLNCNFHVCRNMKKVIEIIKQLNI